MYGIDFYNDAKRSSVDIICIETKLINRNLVRSYHFSICLHSGEFFNHRTYVILLENKALMLFNSVHCCSYFEYEIHSNIARL